MSTKDARTVNMVHYPSKDATDPRALDEYLDAIPVDALDTTGTPSSSTYLSGTGAWTTPPGAGDVSKVGTPVDDQVGVWTGDGTIEGDSNFTWDGSTLTVTGTVDATIVDNEKTLTITPYLSAFDLVTDQSAALKAALIDFFDGTYQTLDLEGRAFVLTSNVVLRCGTDGFTTTPNILRNSEKRICNGKIVWDSTDSGSATTDYMIDIGCPQSVIGASAFLNVVFDNVVFDGNGASKNLVRFFNFYNCLFNQCHFLDYDEGVAVFLSSTDDSSNYLDDNGAIFHNCRWADLTTSDGLTGTPILAYCGDIVIDGGWAEWSGPFDFHIGSITISNFHWSYGPYSGQTESRRGAIFRDPRGITLVNNDCDYANFYFTNDGYFGGTTHNGETNWRGIYIAGNKYTANYAPPTGEGIITFETTVASTQIANFYVAVGGITLSGALSDNSVDFLRVIASGSGTYSTTNGIYVYNDYFGLKPGGDNFAPSSGATGQRTYIANDAFDTTGNGTFSGGTLNVGVDDTTPGVIEVFGGAATEDGGAIHIYQPADEDGTVEYWNIEAAVGDLFMQTSGGTNTLILRDDFDVEIPNGTLRLGQDTNGWLLTDANGDVSAVGAWVAHGDNPKATTSGTSVTFASIPSWATEIKLSFNGVSTNSASQQLQIRLGDAGGIETNDYFGRITSQTGGGTGHTTGFAITRTANYDAADTAYGDAILRLADGSTRWNLQSMISLADDSVLWVSGGSKATSAALTQIQVTTLGGTATFDAGSISLFYR